MRSLECFIFFVLIFAADGRTLTTIIKTHIRERNSQMSEESFWRSSNAVDRVGSMDAGLDNLCTVWADRNAKMSLTLYILSTSRTDIAD